MPFAIASAALQLRAKSPYRVKSHLSVVDELGSEQLCRIIRTQSLKLVRNLVLNNG
jgi:hypothetical protein